MTRISKSQIRYVRSLTRKKERDEAGVFVAEGKKCTEQLLQCFPPILIAATSEQLPFFVSSAPEQVLYEATEKEIEQMSSLRAPQGVVAVFKRSNTNLLSVNTNDYILVLDGVQDPGNLGTIIRTADWFGIRDIICSLNTADCFSPKVVQATMGAIARVRVHYIDLPAWLLSHNNYSAPLPHFCGSHSVPIYGTLLDGKDLYSPDAIPDKRSGIIVMGNEGNGLSPEVRKLVTHSLRIPSFPPNAPTSESLNVAIATAVILAHFRQPDHSA